MSIWNLHKKFQLSSAMGLRDFDLQSQPTLMGGNPLIVVQWFVTPILGGNYKRAQKSEEDGEESHGQFGPKTMYKTDGDTERQRDRQPDRPTTYRYGVHQFWAD